MRLIRAGLEGVYLIEIDRLEDDRGFFARTWCRTELRLLGLESELVQSSVSFNTRKGTLRGMHFQLPPFEEAKYVRCTLGAVYDVVLDLRAASSTYRKWAGFELSAENRRSVYVPKGCAHGFQTVEENTELFYQMTESYHPEAASGVRWDDPAFGISWPLPQPILSEADRSYPDFMG